MFFLLLFVTFLLVVSFVSYFLLVKGVRSVTFCYFFTNCNFDKLFFTVEKGQGVKGSIHFARGEIERGAG